MRHRWASRLAGIAVVGLAAALFAPGLRAQVPDDAKRAALEAKIATVQPLACVPATTPADPAVTALKAALDALATQYGVVLNTQITALNGGQVPNLSADDQKVIATSRQAKLAVLGPSQICDPSAQKLFTAVGGGVVVAAAATKTLPPTSPAANISFTPAVVRAGDQEVSDQGQASVAIKNNGDPVRLGAAKVCLYDKSNCLEQGEIFQVADGTDKCNNPMAKGDQCSLKILFTPKRAFNYSQWLKVPLVEADGQPTMKADGKTPEVLMIPLQGSGFVANMAHVEATGISASHPSLRAVVGLDIGGATATDTQQKLFVDFALNAPIGSSSYTVCIDDKGVPLTTKGGKLIGAKTDAEKAKVIRNYEDCQDLRTAQQKQDDVRYFWRDQRSDPLESRSWWFLNPRITSLPQQASAISSLSVQGITDSLTGQKTSLVQGVDVQGGVEVMIIKPREGRAFYGSFKNTKQRLGLAWVTAVGFASPFAAPGDNPTVFTLDPKSPLRHQFQATGTQCGTATATSPCDVPASFTNIAFVNEERSRFFRRYYTGLRFKTYHFSKAFQSKDCDPDYKNECEGVYNAYPGLADITFGQDEQVSGGHLSGFLFRLDAAYPLPFVPGTYIFGGVNSLLQKNRNTPPLFLPATSTTAISDPSVFMVTVPLRNRDNYRLGIGVDLLQVITQAKQAGNKNAAGAGTTTQQNGAANDKATPAPAAAPATTTPPASGGTAAPPSGAAAGGAAPAQPAPAAKPN
jgi:hypothetical protein